MGLFGVRCLLLQRRQRSSPPPPPFENAPGSFIIKTLLDHDSSKYYEIHIEKILKNCKIQ